LKKIVAYVNNIIKERTEFMWQFIRFLASP